MNMKNNTILAVVGVIAVLALAGFAAGHGFGRGYATYGTTDAGAFQGMGGMHGMMGQGFKNGGMMAMHTEVEGALESGDYQAFLDIHEEYGMSMDITEEQFQQMAKWHEAMEEGDYDTLNQMKADGFQPGFGKMGGMGRHGGCPMMQG